MPLLNLTEVVATRFRHNSVVVFFVCDLQTLKLWSATRKADSYLILLFIFFLLLLLLLLLLFLLLLLKKDGLVFWPWMFLQREQRFGIRCV